MQRHPTTQDISWFTDLYRLDRINLEPPYQRRSVWSVKDKQFFLDTIFNNYPSPALLLEKTTKPGGGTLYNVVDGKQRISTILDFFSGKLRLAKDIGNITLSGRRFDELEDAEKRKFYNYLLTVEMLILDGDSTQVNSIFDRFNRNAKKLTPQELRNARYEGKLLSILESESSDVFWKEIGFSTTARVKRMLDIQFISELFMLSDSNNLIGFDQEKIDEFYSKYEDASDEDFDILRKKFSNTKEVLREVCHNSSQIATEIAKSFYHLYTFWSIATTQKFQKNHIISVWKLIIYHQDKESIIYQNKNEFSSDMETYYTYTLGASTDAKPRKERYDAVVRMLEVVEKQ